MQKNLKEEEQVKFPQGEEGTKNIQEPVAINDKPTSNIMFRYKQVTFSERVEQSNDNTSVPQGDQEEQSSLYTDEDQEEAYQDGGNTSKTKIDKEMG